MARIVANGLLGTMQSLGMAGSIAQACPGGVFRVKMAHIVNNELCGPKRKGDLRIGWDRLDGELWEPWACSRGGMAAETATFCLVMGDMCHEK